MSEVYHFHLINREQIAGRVSLTDDQHIVIEFPMIVENKIVEGMSAINLSKYLPFAAQEDQFITLKRDHIVSMTPATVNFTNYWYNSVQFQLIYMQPQIEANMVSINKSLEQVLSGDNQKFLDALKKYELRMPTETSEKLH